MIKNDKKKDISVTEAYRVLITNIEYSSYDKPIKVIVVTSSEASDGKTTIAQNIALSMAEANKKVILVDCDMRKPSVHIRLRIPNNQGLSEILTGKCEYTKNNYYNNKNIDIITSGKTPPNPVEMLSSKNMDKLLDKLKMSYDYIIIDSPPLMAVADAQILSIKADGTILVVRELKSKKTNVIEAKKILERNNCNILGVVINSASISDNSYYE